MEALALQTKGPARWRPGRNGQHHRAFDRRHLHLCAQHRLIKPHRQFETHIIALALEERVRANVDRHQRIAIAARPRLALPRQAHLPAAFDARRQFEIDRLAVGQRHPWGLSIAASSNGTCSRYATSAPLRTGRCWAPPNGPPLRRPPRPPNKSENISPKSPPSAPNSNRTPSSRPPPPKPPRAPPPAW